MEYIVITICVLIFIAVYGAAFVTYHTAQSDYFETNQKYMIIALAWLLPIIGPAIVFRVLSEDKPIKPRPGVPLLDFIFLSAVFTQEHESSVGNNEASDTSTEITHGGGDDT